MLEYNAFDIQINPFIEQSSSSNLILTSLNDANAWF